MQGIETVRRDNCLLVRNVVTTCLERILINKDVAAAQAYVRSAIADLLMNRMDLSLLVITKVCLPNLLPCILCPARAWGTGQRAPVSWGQCSQHPACCCLPLLGLAQDVSLLHRSCPVGSTTVSLVSCMTAIPIPLTEDQAQLRWHASIQPGLDQQQQRKQGRSALQQMPTVVWCGLAGPHLPCAVQT